MSKDTNRLLGHADEADGIEEYDNPLPDWWLGLFWGSIIWSIGYVAWFSFTDQSQVRWYDAEVAAAEARYPDQTEASAQFVYSDEAAAAGEEVWNLFCFQCHGASGEGGIGPSLIDDEWIHGTQAEAILGTIRNGVLEKAMPAWSGVLSAEQVNQVTSYVIQRNAASTGRSVGDILAPAAEADGASEVQPDGAVADTAQGSAGLGVAPGV